MGSQGVGHDWVTFTRRDKNGLAVCKPGRALPSENHYLTPWPWTPSQPPKSKENTFLLFKLPGLWYFCSGCLRRLIWTNSVGSNTIRLEFWFFHFAGWPWTSYFIFLSLINNTGSMYLIGRFVWQTNIWQDQIASIPWITEKAKEFHKNIYFCFIDCDKAFDCVDYNKLENSSRDGNTRPPYQPPEKPVCRSRSNG